MAVQAERRTKLKVICAWCGKDMGEKDGQGIEGVSHSICLDCLEKFLSQEKSEIIAEAHHAK